MRRSKASGASDAESRAALNYLERKRAFAATVPDYEITVNSDAARGIAVLPRVVTFIERTVNGPSIGYHFAKNPEDLMNIQKLPPHRMMEELWKLDSKVTKERQLNAWNPWLSVAAIGDSA